MCASININICTYTYTYMYIYRLALYSERCHGLACTRDFFTSNRLCTNQSSFHSSRPPALPTLLQYYCTTIGNYKTPLDLPCVCHAPYNIGNNNIV